MRKGLRLWTLFFAVILVSLALFAGNLYAQDTAVNDDFDTDSLDNYEHSQDVVITEGALKVQPGNFLFSTSQWSYPEIDLKFKMNTDSSIVVQYHASDEGTYGVQIINFDVEEIMLFSDSGGQRDEFGFLNIDGKLLDSWNEMKISFSGSAHEVTLNGEKVLEAEDDKGIGPGAVGIICEGGNPIQVDSLAIKGSASDGEVVPAGQGQDTGNGTPVEEEQVPAVTEGQAIETTATDSTGQTQDTTGWRSLLGQLFVTGAPPLDMQTFLINLGLSALLAYILGLVYIYWGASLSNRRKFATNFILLTVTTTFIILVVRSSVALSLGLVGALSIVRFRAAIKEPEELAYLFLAIGLGIGLGDNQRIITLIAFAVAVVILGLLKLFRRAQADVNLHLNISIKDKTTISIDEVQKALKPHIAKIKLLRFDKSDNRLEMSFLVEFRKLTDLNSARLSLEGLSEDINITFLDNKGIW
jgi:hypothetical protein